MMVALHPKHVSTVILLCVVYEDSIAEKTGLQVGDIIVRVNNNPMIGLLHAEAHDLILAAGQEFLLAVERNGNFVEMEDELQSSAEAEASMEKSTKGSLETINEVEAETESIQATKAEVTDEQIAVAISGQAEVLEENVMGVNFNKIDLTESTVLQALHEDVLNTTVNFKDRKWSTFLQAPNRPRVIPKKKEDEGPQYPPYRVIIKKQKKKEERDRELLEKAAAQEVSEIEENTEGVENTEMVLEEREENNDLEDLEEEGSREDIDEEETELEQLRGNEEEDKEIREEGSILEELNEQYDDSVFEEERNKTDVKGVSTTESSQTLEEQLAQVQQQLQALAQLPSTIQESLDSLTQQLCKIVKATHKKKHEEEEETITEQEIISDEEIVQQEAEGEISDSVATIEETGEYNTEEDTTPEGDEGEEPEQAVQEEEAEEDKLEEKVKEPTEEELEEQRKEHEKVEREEEFHQRRLEQRPTNPLMPLQRPIVLPGGRRWAEPGDVKPTAKKPQMSDEQICETLDTYSEVITGRLKGSSSGTASGRGATPLSPSTGTVRINFLKYTPPPRNLDFLQHSEVFKLIHDMDSPQKGIAARPGKVASKEDYYIQQHYQEYATLS